MVRRNVGLLSNGIEVISFQRRDTNHAKAVKGSCKPSLWNSSLSETKSFSKSRCKSADDCPATSHAGSCCAVRSALSNILNIMLCSSKYIVQAERSIIDLSSASVETCGSKAAACAKLAVFAKEAGSFRTPQGVCLPFGNMEKALSVRLLAIALCRHSWTTPVFAPPTEPHLPYLGY